MCVQEAVRSSACMENRKARVWTVNMTFLNLHWRLPLPFIFTMGMGSCHHHTREVSKKRRGGGFVHHKHVVGWSQTLVWIDLYNKQCIYIYFFFFKNRLFQTFEVRAESENLLLVIISIIKSAKLPSKYKVKVEPGVCLFLTPCSYCVAHLGEYFQDMTGF